jgi:hypothetical protein
LSHIMDNNMLLNKKIIPGTLMPLPCTSISIENSRAKKLSETLQFL